MSEIKTNYFVPMSELIKERLELYNITKEDLITRLNITKEEVELLLKGKLLLTNKIAVALEKVINLDSEFLLNYDYKYKEFLKK